MAFQKNRTLDGGSNPKVQGDNNKVNFCSHGPVKFQVFIAILSLRWTKTNFSLRRVEKKKKGQNHLKIFETCVPDFFMGLQTRTFTCCIHPRIHHTSRARYHFHSFSKFIVYVVTTLIFPTNQW